MLSYLAIFLLGVFAGICLVAVALWYMLSYFFVDPDSKFNVKPSVVNSTTFQLPPVLLSKINDESCKSKESCWALNFILYFLFRELRNSEQIRRWLLRKLSLEFDELLTSSVLGKVFSNISIHNLDVGHNFPVINWLKTSKVELHPIFKSISTLDILVDLDYAGGFQFAISCSTHLKHSAFLSVQINGVKGQARLQFQTDPYAHWSFSFVDNADIDISVVSQMGGKSFGQVTSIISSQLKRSVRKKHTLPMFKIRYKPFFTRVEHILASLVPDAAPHADSKGMLTVTLVECRGLMPSMLPSNGIIYAHLAAGDFNWVAAYPESPDSAQVYLILDVVCVKTAKREVNLDFTLFIQNDIPVVESVHPSPARNTRNLRSMELEPGDEIVSVDGKKVSTVKQCIKNFRSSSSTKVIWRIRRRFDMSEACDIGGGCETMSSLDVRKSAKLERVVPQDEGTSDSPSHSRHSSDETTEFDNMNSNESNSRKNFTFQRRNSSSIDDRTHQVFRSSDFPVTKDPIFMESFNLQITESSRYVNITLWSSKPQNSSNSSSVTNSPAKKKKGEHEEYFPFGKDRIVGVLTIPVFDVISESGTTGQGYFIKDYYLGSPDYISSAAKEHSLRFHSGFEPAMCYGKLTVSFMWTKSGHEDASKRKDSLDSLSSNSASTAIETGIEASADPMKLSPSEDTQEHRFVRTHFRSATICDYCNKKIWLKEAFICQVCSMKCHKKCYERCMANTVCAASQQTSKSLPNKSTTPEIITTESEPYNDNDGDNDDDSRDKNSINDHNLAANSNTVRRRTLGGLIVSAVQNRSAQLRRAGSATTLSSLNPNSASRSLPPSPQVSPTTSRKTSVASGSSGNVYPINPFETLDASGLDISEADLNAVVDHLMQHPNDDLVSMAKETDRDVFSDVPNHLRKFKLNQLLNRLQEEIDSISNERISSLKDDSAASSADQTAKCEKMQALALLMLHYLQHVQDLEDSETDGSH